MAYVQDDNRHSTAFDVSSIPKVSRDQAAAEVAQSRPSALDSMASSSKLPEPTPAPATAAEAQSSYAAQLAAIPELQSYGSVYKSSAKPVELTESETEYVVTAVKHVFKEHIVFQFNLSNTIPDTVLEQVSVIMAPSPESGLTEDFIMPVSSLSTGGAGVVYVSFTRDEPAAYAAGSFGCTLRFVSKEVDPTSGAPEEEGYQDEYQVEDCELGAGDVSNVCVRTRYLSDAVIVHHSDIRNLCKRVGQARRRCFRHGDLCAVFFRISKRSVPPPSS